MLGMKAACYNPNVARKRAAMRASLSRAVRSGSARSNTASRFSIAGSPELAETLASEGSEGFSLMDRMRAHVRATGYLRGYEGRAVVGAMTGEGPASLTKEAVMAPAAKLARTRNWVSEYGPSAGPKALSNILRIT